MWSIQWTIDRIYFAVHSRAIEYDRKCCHRSNCKRFLVRNYLFRVCSPNIMICVNVRIAQFCSLFGCDFVSALWSCIFFGRMCKWISATDTINPHETMTPLSHRQRNCLFHSIPFLLWLCFCCIPLGRPSCMYNSNVDRLLIVFVLEQTCLLDVFSSSERKPMSKKFEFNISSYLQIRLQIGMKAHNYFDITTIITHMLQIN